MKLPANWKVGITALGGYFFAGMTWLSSLSYDNGWISVIVPPEHKHTVTMVSAGAAGFLLFLNALRQKDKAVVGGTVQQDTSGKIVPEHKADLVEATKAASPLNGKKI